MTKNKDAWIHVPALEEGGRIIVPEAELSKDVVTQIHERKRYEKYQAMWSSVHIVEVPARVITHPTAEDFKGRVKLPTLAVLRHAYFDKTPEGTWVSPEFRKAVLLNRDPESFLPVLTEYTSTQKTVRTAKKCEVVPKGYKPIALENQGGNSFDVLEPPEGWVVRYCHETGYPEVTSQNRRDAGKVFGKDASYFHPGFRDWGVVIVGNWHDSRMPDKGRFPVGSFLYPNEPATLFNTGGRRCKYAK